MRDFELYNDGVVLISEDNKRTTIYFNNNSGKVYYRYKIGTISDVKHPGIFLGTDRNGISWFIHNHYQIRRACVVTEREFTQGQPLYLYNEYCSNSPRVVIRKGLEKVVDKENYHFLMYNCQTFTNQACHNVRKSEDAEKWLAGLALVSLIGIGIALASGGSKRR